MSLLDPQRQREDTALQRLAATLGEDPFVTIEELRQAGRRKATAEGVAYRMEHERKVLLARVANEIAVTHAKEALSEAKIDRLARADERYMTLIKGLEAAVEERELANSEYWALRAHLEWLRAAISHDNVLARLGEP